MLSTDLCCKKGVLLFQHGGSVNTVCMSCLSLCVSVLQSEEPVSSVVLLAQHLEGCNLQDFWAATNSCKDTIKQGV